MVGSNITKRRRWSFIVLLAGYLDNVNVVGMFNKHKEMLRKFRFCTRKKETERDRGMLLRGWSVGWCMWNKRKQNDTAQWQPTIHRGTATESETDEDILMALLHFLVETVFSCNKSGIMDGYCVGGT